VKVKRNTRYAWRIVYSVFLFLLAGCGQLGPEETLFIPPAPVASPTSAATTISMWTATPAEESLPTETAVNAGEQTPQPEISPTAGATAAETCINDLKFLADLTVPDGSPINPNERIDKQWRVVNSGTCDWDADYRLKLVGGFAPLGAEIVQALFPARAGAEVMIQIFFIAPPTSGVYRSAWQASDPQGQPFGETIYIEIVVP
jgi:predicted small lipoprotein YifL